MLSKYKVILDTNVVIYDPLVLFSFNETEVLLPLVVLEELDKCKMETTDQGFNARTAIKYIEQISKLGSIAEGVMINNENCTFLMDHNKQFKSTFRILFESNKKTESLNLSMLSNDNKILKICMEEKERYQEQVKLVTKDINLRVKARSLGIETIDFDYQPFNLQSMKGFREEELDSDELKFLSERTLSKHFDLSGFLENEYLVVRSRDNNYRTRAFRFSSEHGFKEVYRHSDIFGFGSKNIGQQLALDLLLDDSIPLVFLVGPAGTGKTLITLLAGLEKVLHQGMYDKLFIARPLVSLGSDIGFVPGDLQEKLFHWMHPFYDNLEYIFNRAEDAGEPIDIPMRRYSHKEEFLNSKKSFRKKNESFLDLHKGGVFETVAELQKKGFLSLEAITHMRGRSIPRQFMFIDEVQNLTPDEVKTIITRAGNGTKIILAGDPYQVDAANMDLYTNGLVTTLMKMRGEPLVGNVLLELSERSELAQLAVKKL